MARQSSSSQPIPLFSLYGETSGSQPLDFVHIEDIHVRSARNNWIIRPHRHNTLFQILAVDSGVTGVFLDDIEYEVNGSCLITVPPGVVHGFRFTPHTQGVVLSLSLHQGMDADSHLQMRELTRPGVLAFGQPGEYGFIRSCLDRIRDELADVRRDQAVALSSLVKLLLVSVRRRMLHVGESSPAPGHSLHLSEKFRQLVDSNFRKHWNISAYARDLHVSVSTLNRACTEHLGMSSKKYLQDRMHTEAKRLLIYTSDNLDVVSDRLGYKDAAYFSRVFRNQEGCSPRDFRRRMGEGIDLITHNSL